MPREIAAQIGPRAEIVEFGAGSLRKVRLLLACAEAAGALPADRHFWRAPVAVGHVRCSADYPGLDVQPVVADYTQRLLLPRHAAGRGPPGRILPRLDASATSPRRRR